MIRKILALGALLIFALGTDSALAQYDANNYSGRQALVVNDNPFVELYDFSFGNATGRNYRSEFRQNLKWRNIGDQSIVSFEVVVVKYDPFGRNLIGSRWVVNGKNSADWTPLPPGTSSGDGTIGYSGEDVFTAVAYVRYVRLADGTVWAADLPKVSRQISEMVPTIREVGNIDPAVRRGEDEN